MLRSPLNIKCDTCLSVLHTFKNVIIIFTSEVARTNFPSASAARKTCYTQGSSFKLQLTWKLEDIFRAIFGKKEGKRMGNWKQMKNSVEEGEYVEYEEGGGGEYVEYEEGGGEEEGEKR